MKKLLFIFTISYLTTPGISASIFNDSAFNKNHFLYGGIHMQKSVGFYWANGFALEYSSPKFLLNKLSLGLNYISSRMGTAMSSNAIPFYKINLSAIKYLRQSKALKPTFRINMGYTRANFGSPVFESIPNKSMLVSFETGAAYDFKIPIRAAITGGYNFIYGNGTKGLGVIFPFYLQFSVMYKILPN